MEAISALRRGCTVRRNWSRSGPKRPRLAMEMLQSALTRPDSPRRIYAIVSENWTCESLFVAPVRFSQLLSSKIPHPELVKHVGSFPHHQRKCPENIRMDLGLKKAEKLAQTKWEEVLEGFLSRSFLKDYGSWKAKRKAQPFRENELRGTQLDSKIFENEF